VACGFAISGSEDLGHVRRGPVALADVHESAYYDANHVAQEAIARDIYDEGVCVMLQDMDVTGVQEAHRVLIGLDCAGKGSKVVFTHQISGGCLHGVTIQPAGIVPTESGGSHAGHTT